MLLNNTKAGHNCAVPQNDQLDFLPWFGFQHLGESLGTSLSDGFCKQCNQTALQQNGMCAHHLTGLVEKISCETSQKRIVIRIVKSFVDDFFNVGSTSMQVSEVTSLKMNVRVFPS